MIDPDGFRAVMRCLASGVTVVTTALDGAPYGMTATSFASVSLDPMLVQVSLRRTSHTHEAIRRAGAFAANILAAGQEEVAHHFSTYGLDRFGDLAVAPGPAGMPLLDGAIAALECRVVEERPGGDHTVFLGEPLSGRAGEGPPLVYFQGAYRRLAGQDVREGLP